MNNHPSPASTLSIRPAAPADAAHIVHLIRQMGADSEITEEYVLHYLSGVDREILLAQRGVQVAGLLSYSLRPDLYHAGNSVLIEELVVEEAHRGQGIGGKLMEALLNQVEGLGCKELCLAVMPGNEAAIRFYKRHGLGEEALFLERHFTP
jgi:ribosomal protein S18 acetylase RimI-like enzyme